METVDSRLRVTPLTQERVRVERLREPRRWAVREYGVDHACCLVEVRPNGSLLPMGPGLVHSAKQTIRVDGSVLETVLDQLGQLAAAGKPT